MRLTTKGRYAVTAMLDLALHYDEGPITLADISHRQDISLSYLEQLFAKLKRNALVKSVRGPGGGYMLAHGPDGTRISDIILAVNEPIRVTRCDPQSPHGCTKTKMRCSTHDLWTELSNQIHLFLNSVTLADVVNRRVLGTSGRFMNVDIPEAVELPIAVSAAE